VTWPGHSTRSTPDALGRTSGQFIRYRALIHRLVALAEAVDPAQALDEQFSATDVVAQLPGGGLDGAIARMRFSGLAQVIQTHFGETKSFEVDGDRGGIVTYWRRLAGPRGIDGSSRRTSFGSASPSRTQTFEARPSAPRERRSSRPTMPASSITSTSKPSSGPI
jgi:hypothetical protein